MSGITLSNGITGVEGIAGSEGISQSDGIAGTGGFPFGNVPEDLSATQIMSSNGMTFPTQVFTGNSDGTKNIVQYRKRRWIPADMDGENVQLGFTNTLPSSGGEFTDYSYPDSRQATVHYNGVVYDVEFEAAASGNVVANKFTFSDAVAGLSLDYATAPTYDEVGKQTITFAGAERQRYTAQPIYYRFGEFHHQSQASDNIDFLDGTEIPVGTEDLTATVGAGTISGVTVNDGGANWSGSVTIWAWEEQADGYVRDVQIGTATLTGDAITSVAVTMNADDWVTPTVYAVPPLVSGDATGFLSHMYVPAATLITGETSGTRDNADCIGDSIFQGIQSTVYGADLNGNSGLWERSVNNSRGAFNQCISGVRLFDFANGLSNFPLYKVLTDRGLFDKTLIQAWTNDLAWSQTPADIQDTIEEVRDYKQGKGSLVQIATGSPRTSSSDTWATVANQSIAAGGNGKKFWYESPTQTVSLGSGVNTSMEMEAIDTDTIVFNDDTNDTFQVLTLGDDLEWTLVDTLAESNTGYYCGMTKVATDTFAHMDSNGATGRVLKKYLLSAGTLAAVGGYSLAFTGANVVSLAYLGSNYLVSYTQNDHKLQLVQDNATNYVKVGSGTVASSGFVTLKVCKLNATTVAISNETLDKIEAWGVDLGTGVFTKLGEIALSSFTTTLLSGFKIFDLEYRSDNNIAFVDPKNRKVYFLAWSGTAFTASANLLDIGGADTINICFPSSTRMIVAIQSTALMKAYDYVNGQLIPVGGDMLAVNAVLRAGTITQDYAVFDNNYVFSAANAEHLLRADQTLLIDSSTNMSADGTHLRTPLAQLWGGNQFAPFLFTAAKYFEFEYLGSSTNTGDLSTYTFSAFDLGLADDRRTIMVGINSRKGGAVSSLGALTINGVTADIIVERWSGGSNANLSAIITAEVPEDATGDIVITFADTMLRCAIHVGRGIQISAVAHDTKNSTAGDPTAALNIPAGGVGIGVACTSGAGSTCTWTGLNEDFDGTIETALFATAAHQKFYAAETGRTILANFTTPNTESAGAFASFPSVA